MNEVKECAVCEMSITEGYLAEWSSECYCSKECAVQDIGESDVREGLEDGTFFYTVWFSFSSIASTTGKHAIEKVYRLHDNIYFTESHARLFDDGKDRVSIQWMVVTPNEVWYEGGQADNYHVANSYQLAKELLAELEEN